LRSHPEEVATDVQSKRYADLIERRATGEPLAYVLGRGDFWSLRLTVTPAVLVRGLRPSCWWSAPWIFGARNSDVSLDLGTGSGAIALTLASERPGWQVSATDVSEDALAIARVNAESLDLKRVQFLQGSWFQPLAGRTFDLILSNPPYVAADDPAMQDPALRHEPRGASPRESMRWASLRAIIESAPDYLERDGWLLLEHGSGQAAEVTRETCRARPHSRTLHRESRGHERMTEAQRA